MRRFSAWFSALTVLALVHSGWAQTKVGGGAPGSPGSASSAAEPEESAAPPAEDDEHLTPRAAYHKGNAAFRAGRFTAARHYYRQALEGEEAFDILCNLGRTEAELKDNQPAYEHLTRCLEIYPADAELAATRQQFANLREEVIDRLSPEQRARADARLAEAAEARAARPAISSSKPSDDVRASIRDDGPVNPGLRLATSLSLLGVGLAGVGLGVGFTVYSSDLAGQAEALRQEIASNGASCSPGGAAADCALLQQTNAQSDEAQHIALGGFIAGGVLVVASGLTYFLWPQRGGSTAALEAPRRTSWQTWQPNVGFDPVRGGAWLSLSGQF